MSEDQLAIRNELLQTEHIPSDIDLLFINAAYETPSISATRTSIPWSSTPDAPIYNHFKRIVKSIGLPDARFHDMRHTFAMISLQNGDDIKTVQHNVGHVSQKMQQDSADRMQDYFDSLESSK